MKKTNFTKRSTEFGTYHEHENHNNDYSSSYDSVEQEKNCYTEEKDCHETSERKDGCYSNSCRKETSHQKTNR